MATYVVGLPVIITVGEDGAVTFDVDFGDTTSAVWEEYDGPAVEADLRVISAAIDARALTYEGQAS